MESRKGSPITASAHSRAMADRRRACPSRGSTASPPQCLSSRHTRPHAETTWASANVQVRLRAEGYPQLAQRLFWMWKARRPHRTHRVCDLDVRLPKLLVPLVILAAVVEAESAPRGRGARAQRLGKRGGHLQGGVCDDHARRLPHDVGHPSSRRWHARRPAMLGGQSCDNLKLRPIRSFPMDTLSKVVDADGSIPKLYFPPVFET